MDVVRGTFNACEIILISKPISRFFIFYVIVNYVIKIVNNEYNVSVRVFYCKSVHLCRGSVFKSFFAPYIMLPI
jgi:hypothetical protein